MCACAAEWNGDAPRGRRAQPHLREWQQQRLSVIALGVHWDQPPEPHAAQEQRVRGGRSTLLYFHVTKHTREAPAPAPASAQAPAPALAPAPCYRHRCLTQVRPLTLPPAGTHLPSAAPVASTNGTDARHLPSLCSAPSALSPCHLRAVTAAPRAKPAPGHMRNATGATQLSSAASPLASSPTPGQCGPPAPRAAPDAEGPSFWSFLGGCEAEGLPARWGGEALGCGYTDAAA